MAQLKSTIVLGDLSVTGAAHLAKLYTNILYAPNAADSNTVTVGSANNVLTSNGTSIYWGQPNLTNLSGTLTVDHGGTGMTSTNSNNAVVIGNSTSTTGAMQTVATANGAFYATSANAKPQFGTLPVAQGGTGATSFTSKGLLTGDGTGAVVAYVPEWQAWVAGTTAGPQAKIKLGNNNYTSAAIPSASSTASGIVTTGEQLFAGIKEFTNQVRFTYNQEAATTTSGSGAVIIGSVTGQHLAFDSNEIMSLSNGTTAATLYLQNEGGIVNIGADTVPVSTNTKNLGSSSLRWKTLYIGTADSYGSATQPIYWNAGVPKATDYALSATVNSATQWGVAYYSTTTNITSTGVGTAGYPLIGAGSAAPTWYGGQTNAGTAAASWITTFNGTTASTSTSTGAVKVSGGVGVAGQVTALRLAANGSNTSYSLYVNGTSYLVGVTTHGGNVVSDTNATDSIGTTGVRWKEGYFSTLLSIGAANTSYVTTDNKNTYIQPGAITLNNNSTTSLSGYNLYGKGAEYARFYVGAFGTAGTYTPADGDTPASATEGSEGRVTLVLGNATSKTPTSETNLGLNNASGSIRIYGAGSTYTDLRSNPNGSRTCYLPYYGGTMYLTCVTGPSKVGDTNQPVYVAANNVIQACTYYLKATVNNATQWGVAYYSTTTNITSTAQGTAGYPLIGQGAAAPTWYGGQVNTGTAAGSWITTFNGTTASTSTATGAVKVNGGVGVAGQVTALRLAANGSNTSYSLYINGTSYLKGNVIVEGNLNPSTTNSYSLGTSTYRWSKLYVGTADSYGSTTQPIYWNAGVPTALTYTANRLYYSASTTSFEATGHYASTDKIAINSTTAPSNTLYVNGVSEFNGNILPASAGSYSIGSKTLQWYGGFFTRTTMRHLDAGTNAVSTDHNLYIGYGAETYTSNIYFYTSTGTTDTVSERTQWFTINSNGAYALTRFGVNGQNTSYNLYVNGTSYLNGQATIAGHVIPSTTTTYDLGSSSLKWRNIYIEGGTEIHGTAYAGGSTHTGWIKFYEIDMNTSNHFGNKQFRISFNRGYNSPSSEVYTFIFSIGWNNATITQINGRAGNRIIEQVRIVQENTNHKIWFEYYVNTSNTTYQNNVSITIKQLDSQTTLGTFINTVQTEADSAFTIHAQVPTNPNGIMTSGTISVGNGTTNNSATITVNGGLLSIVNNGNTLTIGAANTGWCHFQNSTSLPFYFSSRGVFNGNVDPYSTNSKDLGSDSLRWRSGYFTGPLFIGNAGYTTASPAVAGTYISQGFIEMSGATPFIDFHNANSTADFTGRIIANNANGLAIAPRLGINADANASYTLYCNGPSSFTNHILMYTPTAGANAYGDGSAIEVREVNMVTTGQNAWSYAPKIGFHWGGRYQGTFGLHSNGAYYLSISAGQGNATLYAGSVYGAVWNDYAEYRIANTKEPGRVIKETPTGEMILTEKRLEKGCEIISDTFGFAIGEDDKAKTPTAATGRVLAYTDKPRETFELGMPVCSGPNGTVSQMTEEEARMYPWCIIGTVSEIPTYEEWGTGNVKVNGRIWIRIR